MLKILGFVGMVGLLSYGMADAADELVDTIFDPSPLKDATEANTALAINDDVKPRALQVPSDGSCAAAAAESPCVGVDCCWS